MPVTLRRLIFGLFWFGVFWIGMSVIGGGMAGAMAGGKSVPPGASFQEGFESGQQAGMIAGIQFRERYGTWVVVGAAVLAGSLTWAGVLPGTRRK